MYTIGIHSIKRCINTQIKYTNTRSFCDSSLNKFSFNSFVYSVYRVTSANVGVIERLTLHTRYGNASFYSHGRGQEFVTYTRLNWNHLVLLFIALPDRQQRTRARDTQTLIGIIMLQTISNKITAVRYDDHHGKFLTHTNI